MRINSPIPAPKAVLFDLFHTLTCVPPPAQAGEIPISQILGVSSADLQRLYYDSDVLGRCLGHVQDSTEAMRRIAHSLDPTIDEARIVAAVASRRRRFETALVDIEPAVLVALNRLRDANVKIALVSDAGADDVESWARSPLWDRFDATIFSYRVGVRKPDPRIYRLALESIDVRPEEALFVGDGGSDEHRGARALGIRPVLVTRLLARWWPDRVAERRLHVDWEFDDVPAFVEALKLSP